MIAVKQCWNVYANGKKFNKSHILHGNAFAFYVGLYCNRRNVVHENFFLELQDTDGMYMTVTISDTGIYTTITERDEPEE